MFEIYSKEGILFVVQVDHISGEICGSIFDCLYDAGARNVQCFATITKKNRPGNVFLIDVGCEAEQAVEEVIVREIGSTGWHKVVTEHRHVPTQVVSREVEIVVRACSFLFFIEAKQTKGLKDSLRAEHACCELLKEKIKSTCDTDIALRTIYTKVQTALLREETKIVFEGIE